MDLGCFVLWGNLAVDLRAFVADFVVFDSLARLFSVGYFFYETVGSRI